MDTKIRMIVDGAISNEMLITQISIMHSFVD